MVIEGNVHTYSDQPCDIPLSNKQSSTRNVLISIPQESGKPQRK